MLLSFMENSFIELNFCKYGNYDFNILKKFSITGLFGQLSLRDMFCVMIYFEGLLTGKTLVMPAIAKVWYQFFSLIHSLDGLIH
jgi:hypothetical protein